MKIKQICFAGAAVLLSALLVAPNSFADEPYYKGMEDYSGGNPLSGDNVTIIPDLVEKLKLKTLVQMSDSNAEYRFNSNPESENEWEDGYVRIDATGEEEYTCVSTKYFKANTDTVDLIRNSVFSFSVSKSSYTVETTFEEVNLLHETSLSKPLAIGVIPEVGQIFYGQKIYSDPGCNSLNGEIGHAEGKPYNDPAFMQLKIKLFDGDEAVVANGLYFGLTDIDAAQSYRILNSSNQLTKDNMFAESIIDLQPRNYNCDEGNCNMFAENTYGNYIYSEFEETERISISHGRNNIYVELTPETLEEGLEMVWGFQAWAWSGIDFYAQQYHITYESEENGKITGQTEEDVLPGGSPYGSTATPNENYEFDYWVADKNVTIVQDDEETTITKGEKLTNEQLKQVVVNQDITFTAVYKAKEYTVTYESEENGKITGQTEEKVDFGNHPTGSTATPNENYEFDYWVANENVIIDEGGKGTIIEKGEKITNEQLKQVVVDQDITFTAVYKKATPKTPDTGLSTSNEKGTIVAASAVTITLISAILYLSRYTIKRQKSKVDFDRK